MNYNSRKQRQYQTEDVLKERLKETRKQRKERKDAVVARQGVESSLEKLEGGGRRPPYKASPGRLEHHIRAAVAVAVVVCNTNCISSPTTYNRKA